MLPRCGADVGSFQSTLPTRGSDRGLDNARATTGDFNPRSPRGGATGLRPCLVAASAISIHAPHEGERLVAPTRQIRVRYISIHAPHEGERLSLLPPSPQSSNISIHAPHEGERRCTLTTFSSPREHFNPRSPRGGATITR